MSRKRAYRCLNCLEHTVSREFDTSHLSVTCPNCGSFERFVNDAVFQQFRAFEEPPARGDRLGAAGPHGEAGRLRAARPLDEDAGGLRRRKEEATAGEATAGEATAGD